MILNSKKMGKGHAIIILHGLFGMSDNWVSIGNHLMNHDYSIHLIDLRNHGSSPHYNTHTYPEMCNDLIEYLDKNSLDEITLIGHSMGGKLAMFFTLLNPERVKKLIVVDIAPSSYHSFQSNYHSTIIEQLQSINLEQYTSKQSVILEIERKLNDKTLALFLSKNIGRNESKQLYWKLNLSVLYQSLSDIYIGLEELKQHAPSPVKTLFLKGNNSDYYQAKHETDRLLFFPNSKVEGIDHAGHWLHAEQPDVFLKKTIAFLQTNELDSI